MTDANLTRALPGRFGIIVTVGGVIGLGALIQELATSLIGLLIFGLALLLFFLEAPDVGTVIVTAAILI
jgi:hypothetical protein